MISFPQKYFEGLYFLQDQDSHNSWLMDLEANRMQLMDLEPYHIQLKDQVKIKDLMDHLEDMDFGDPPAG